MSTDCFHPLVAQWFRGRFGRPTEPQAQGWPHIAAGTHTLIAAPTGSGKTLAAFLVCLDKLVREWFEGRLDERTHVVYVSPLKALSSDIQRNLQVPLEEIRELAAAQGLSPPEIRVVVRTGDTPAGERQAMLRHPPHILVTTPESLYLMLTAERSRQILRGVGTMIVDEIHALARDKRGSHLSLSLERLETLCEASPGGRAPVRIGLSATQKPIDDIARFLVGARRIDADGTPRCRIIDAGHVRALDLAVEVPPSELSAVCSLEQWGEVYQRLVELIQAHRSTLVFVNTRRMAERVAHHLRELLGEDAVASHHGSLARRIRHDAEQRLKAGQLRAIVATASLEMGIDVGYIDLACQIGASRSIATFLQRVGRSGHSLGALPKGRLFPLTRDELVECLALVRAVRRGDLDRIEIPVCPLDILAQQIVAAVSADDWEEDALFDLCRRAWPFRDLSRADFDAVLRLVSEGIAPGNRRGAHLHHDQIGHRLRARRGARIAAVTSGGAIPETAEFRVVTEEDGTLVGTVDEDFAVESLAGDVFLLGNTSWRIRYVRGGEVVVSDAQGAPPSIPFWLGEGPGRTIELSGEVSRLRREIGERLKVAGPLRVPSPEPAQDLPLPVGEGGSRSEPGEGSSALLDATAEPSPALTAVADRQDIFGWLDAECGASPWAAQQATAYVAAQLAAIGLVPTAEEIVFERFFDESGGMQLVIHAPLGSRINRAWGLALRKRFCRSFDFELQAAADDDGILLSLGPQHSFPIDSLFKMLGTHNAEHLLVQALLAVPMFQVRWRWNVTRALVILRQQGGKKVPPFLQKFRSDDLLAAVFPETVGCLENHSGDVEIPDHPLVRQTMHDCLHEAMDVDRWVALLGRVQAGEVRLVPRDTREPSPFAHEILNANPYAFLDGAPLEERRTRAVTTRRSLSVEDMRDLGRLDPAAIDQVREEAWPVVRDADELHDALSSFVTLDEADGRPWNPWFDELISAGRATRALRAEQPPVWVAAERWPVVAAAWAESGVTADPPLSLPEALNQPVETTAAWVELVRGRVLYTGPVTAAGLAQRIGLAERSVFAALEALEGKGEVLRGRFTAESLAAEEETGEKLNGHGENGHASNGNGTSGHAASDPAATTEWCDRRLLARIHRLTLDGLRKRIQPVEPADFLRFLARHHRLLPETMLGGPGAVRDALAQLEGFEMPAGAWERHVLRARVAEYDPQWLDGLFLSGEAMWGRLRPPRKDSAQGASSAALTRTVPMSLLLRSDLAWLLPPAREGAEALAGSRGQEVLAALKENGASFFQELAAQTGMLAAHLEEALRELAALGLVTSDAFAAVRAIVEGNKKQTGRRAARGRRPGAASGAGRWSLFPGKVKPPAQDEWLDQWCRLLLRRYGVVFRDLLTRETAAPPWFQLVPVLRRMERRGEIRGGRFIAQVAGEQFAAEETVRRLREIRDLPGEDPWLVLSAADPLNLVGILTPGGRLPAIHTGTLVLHSGRYLAARHGGQTQFFAEVEPGLKADLARALELGRRPLPLLSADPAPRRASEPRSAAARPSSRTVPRKRF